MTILDLSLNVLTSSLPKEINNLQKLREYNVRGNLITGTLPFEAGSNLALEVFGCERKELTGDISRLIHLPRRAHLELANNKFTGTIPREICNLPLEHIEGQNNMMTGSLPDCLGDLTTLRHFLFNSNHLIGSIPKFRTSLIGLALGGNQFTGRIPFGPFPSMTLLSLYSNNFTAGTIPTEFATLTNLQHSSLEGCQLTGTIPSEIGLLTRLTSWDLGGNRLNGTIPTEVGMLENLRFLVLGLNRLTRTIPSEMGRLTSLQLLSLNSNLLVDGFLAIYI